ncbi:glutamate 5-kinase [Candidatus Gracilibacteria bacterium]|nr:glutamate 5-kinase [Candidatus Gracilibacteria bacterium]
MKKVLVLKVGTAAITNGYGDIEEVVVENICQQLSILHNKYNVILVSSGAVGAGKKYLQNYAGSITEKKAAAALGNPRLIQKYAEFFQHSQVGVAQVLCERHHFSNRKQFLQLRSTCEALWENNIIPIINENDVISDHSLKFSDNDEMATLLAIGFSAEKLLFGSSMPGLLDGEEVIPRIEKFSAEIFSCAKPGTSRGGLGGMISKLSCTRLATNFGTTVVIFDVRKDGNILRAEQFQTGTVCSAQLCNISAHKKWMATGSLPTGRVVIDLGAAEALKKRKSLLLVGVKSVEGDFEKGDIIEIYVDGMEGVEDVFAVARAKISFSDFESNKKQKNVEIAHANEIVIF